MEVPLCVRVGPLGSHGGCEPENTADLRDLGKDTDYTPSEKHSPAHTLISSHFGILSCKTE